jgi:hypothetical protein
LLRDYGRLQAQAGREGANILGALAKGGDDPQARRMRESLEDAGEMLGKLHIVRENGHAQPNL